MTEPKLIGQELIDAQAEFASKRAALDMALAECDEAGRRLQDVLARVNDGLAEIQTWIDGAMVPGNDDSGDDA